MTPKQRLAAHLAEMHPSRSATLPKRATLEQLQRWHATEHHRHAPNHHHGGMGRGVGERPVGWRTGENAVLIKIKNY